MRSPESAPPEEICYRGRARWDWRLDVFHTTRHATDRQATLAAVRGWQVSSPWLARFDWVLDHHPEWEPGSGDVTMLTRRRERPRSVFVCLGRLNVFLDHVLPRLEEPVVVYLGNHAQPLSSFLPYLHRLLGHPQVAAVLSENRDLDIPSITAMPVGVHPVDVLLDDGAQTLERLAGAVGNGAKEARVLAPVGRAAERLGISSASSPAYPERVSLVGACLATSAYWEALAAHRFLLVPFDLTYDTPAPFEALILGTIPIMRRGPLAEAYAGLPVVTIDDPGEITRANLDRWWNELSGAFDDTGFLHAGHWWGKVSGRMPAPKRAFLVLGPESHGNHFVTELLVRAGCHGQAGDHSSWQGEWQEGAEDVQPWDRNLPTDEDPIVWRRSVPHLRNWPDIVGIVNALRGRGYEVQAVVVHRDRYSAVRSQMKWRHVRDAATARSNIDRAYRHIFAHLEDAAVPAICVTYEALVEYPAAREELLRELALQQPVEPFEVWNGNRKWHGRSCVIDAATPDRGRALVDVCHFDGFPEHWFRCEADQRVEYEQRVDCGRARMRESRIVFCGLARDVADTLPVLRRSIEHLGSLCRDYRVVVYENDSVDETAERLREWSRDNPRVVALTETLGAPRWGQVRDLARMRQLAAARNRYLDYVCEHWGDFDHVVVVDFDLALGFSHEGVAHSFSFDDWDVMASNMVSSPPDGPPPPPPMFFDAWAFRPVGEERAASLNETNRLYFPSGTPRVPVWSAFGGVALYSMAALRSGARYGGDDCEHVVLHRQLRDRGYGRIFLNPSQIVIHVEDDPRPVLLSHSDYDDATIGEGLGMTDYSYHFVHEAFRPVLESLANSIPLRSGGEAGSGRPNERAPDVRPQAEAKFAACRRSGRPCLFLSFTPPHAMPTGLSGPAIPVFAWEFHDLPCEEWEGDPRQDWCAVLREAGAAITHSNFAAEVVRRSMGEGFPVLPVPAPVWDRFAALRARPHDRPELAAREVTINGTVFDTGRASVSVPLRAAARATFAFDGTDDEPPPCRRQISAPIVLEGVVYTSVFSPSDGRKNWQDILRAFCLALGNRSDATLVLKLIGPMPFGFGSYARELERLRPFRCRVVVIDAFLDEAEYERLLSASTFVVNASSGEGQCLPLMQAMSAGVPAIAPDHTAMADYVDPTNSFVVASTREPCAWPQDPRGKYRTTCHRPDVMSLIAAFRSAYEVATGDPARYGAMSAAATASLRRHCSEEVVRERLRGFLPLLWGSSITPVRVPE